MTTEIKYKRYSEVDRNIFLLRDYYIRTLGKNVVVNRGSTKATFFINNEKFISVDKKFFTDEHFLPR